MTISWSSFSNKVDFVNSNLLNRGLFALAYWTAIAEESIRKQSMSIPEIIEWINAKGERAPSNSNLLRYFANNENLIRSIRGHEQLHFAYYLSEAKRDFPFAFSDELEFDDSGFLLFHENDFSKSYIIAIIREVNACYTNKCWTSCAVLLRKFLETMMIEAFEKQGMAKKIQDQTGNYLGITDVKNELSKDLFQNKLSREARKALQYHDIIDLGHRSAHERYFQAKKKHIDDWMLQTRALIDYLKSVGL